MALSYWPSSQVCEYLKIEPNNLHQIATRFRLRHEKQGHTSNGKCSCLLVEYRGPGAGENAWKSQSYFRADKVKDYALCRKGQPSEIGRDRAKREVRDQPVGKISKGRPTTKTKGR